MLPDCTNSCNDLIRISQACNVQRPDTLLGSGLFDCDTFPKDNYLQLSSSALKSCEKKKLTTIRQKLKLYCGPKIWFFFRNFFFLSQVCHFTKKISMKFIIKKFLCLKKKLLKDFQKTVLKIVWVGFCCNFLKKVNMKNGCHCELWRVTAVSFLYVISLFG